MEQSVNVVQAETIIHYITQHYGTINEIENFTHENYQIMNLLGGVGYNTNLSRFDFSAALLLGLAKTNYPYYQEFLPFIDNPNDGRIWAHMGERPDLFTFMGGSSVQIAYRIKRFSVGIEAVYQFADFDYFIQTETQPGGNNYPERMDRLKTSLLKMGLQLSYALGKEANTKIALQ